MENEPKDTSGFSESDDWSSIKRTVLPCFDALAKVTKDRLNLNALLENPSEQNDTNVQIQMFEKKRKLLIDLENFKNKYMTDLYDAVLVWSSKSNNNPSRNTNTFEFFKQISHYSQIKYLIFSGEIYIIKKSDPLNKKLLSIKHKILFDEVVKFWEFFYLVHERTIEFGKFAYACNIKASYIDDRKTKAPENQTEISYDNLLEFIKERKRIRAERKRTQDEGTDSQTYAGEDDEENKYITKDNFPKLPNLRAYQSRVVLKFLIGQNRNIIFVERTTSGKGNYKVAGNLANKELGETHALLVDALESLEIFKP